MPKKKKKIEEEDPKKNEKAKGLKWNKEQMKKMKLKSLRHLMSDLVREDTLDGVDCWVIPTVMIVEGVHNEALYTSEELEKFPQAWNSIPVVINHPVDEDGNPAGAGSKEVIENQKVGDMLNVQWVPEIHGLRGETWISKEKLLEVSEGDVILKKLNENEPIEVSTGLFTESDDVDGLWHNEPYDCTVINFRPDHLALLPHSKGACSWEDGGGMPRLNEEEKVKLNEAKKTYYEWDVKNNELSHGEIHVSLSSLVRDKINPGHNEWVFVVEVKDETFVYEVDRNGDIKMFQQSYAVDADEEVALSGDPVEVEKEVEFVPVSNEDPSPNSKEEDMDRKKLVDALIANEECAWTEEDRDFLMGIKEDKRFEKLTQEPEKAPKANDDLAKPATAAKADDEDGAKAKEPEKPAEEKPAEELEDKKPQTLTEYLDAAPAEIREPLARSHRRNEAAKARVVKALLENEKCTFSEDELKAKTLDELEKLAQLSVGKERAEELVDYSGRNAGEPTTLEEDEIPAPPSLTEAFAKKA